MSRETVLMDAEGIKYSYENLKTQGWLEGHYSGLDHAIIWLKDHAVKLFQAGQHDQAIKMQKLADEMQKALEPGMRKRAKDHEKDFPVVIIDEDE